MGEVAESGLLQSLPPELRLAIACSAWPAEQQRVQAALDAGIDWDHFLRVIKRQRVAGLVYAQLKNHPDEVPATAMEALATGARQQTMDSLTRAMEAHGVVSRMRAAGIRVAVLKGAPLAMLAYGELGLRHSRDNDLLVEQADALAAAQVIEASGYTRRVPHAGWTAEHMDAWFNVSKNFEYLHAQTGHALDLHWRAVDNPLLAPGRFGMDALQDVAIARQLTLPTLPTDELLLYLCVHGATHAWFRLKWLADVAALLHKGGPDALARLQRDARRAGLQRPVHLAMSLSDALFATGMPAGVRCDRATTMLLKQSIDALTVGRGAADAFSDRFGSTRLRMGQYLLRGDRRYRTRQLQNDLAAGHQAPSSATGWMRVVPRVTEWVWRHVRAKP